MSVLLFPRIYFKGYASWDPCTFNNNDFSKFPTFNAALAALNWPFLAIQDPPITPDNFTQTFRSYAIKLQGDSIDNPAIVHRVASALLESSGQSRSASNIDAPQVQSDRFSLTEAMN